jgi:CelD/BcsL family acetyltransferase involved in cellulose biosynthesis
MNITVLRPQQLTPAQIQAWSAIQRGNPELQSPFLRPEFAIAVSRVRSDVEVGVLEEARRPVGFFPFQRGPWNMAKPVGGRLCDCEAVIVPQNLSWNIQDVLVGCGLQAWEFSHLPVTQIPLQRYFWNTTQATYMDLSDGFDQYVARRSSKNTITNTQNRTRKIQREIGPLRFEPHTTDSGVFDKLLEWKRRQYQATGATDVFAYPWTVQLLKLLLSDKHAELSLMMSALYVTDRLIAVHLGLHAYGVLQFWFPAYERELSAYSPGAILLLQLAQKAPSLGIHRVELGKCTSSLNAYKTHFMSGSTMVAQGCAVRGMAATVMRHGMHNLKAWAKSSPLAPAARFAGRLMRPVRGWLALR